MNSPLLFTLTGPTGSGKSTIARRLLALDQNLILSVSTTTRLARKGEVDGQDYFFVSREEFKQRVVAGKFIEHAEFSGNLYGTETRNVDLVDQKRKDLVLDIEVKGVQQLRKLYGNRVVCIFIFPVSFDEMEKRLRARGSESEEQIQKRLKRAQEEVQILESPGFSDYKVFNDDLEKAVKDVFKAIGAARLRL